ncbi:nuclear transport factor 2 family protein [Mycolicibacterium thermoresistibile]
MPGTQRPADVAADITTLVDIEAIKRLKARYCRHLDHKDWPAWRALFTDDFVSDTGPAGGKTIHGADEFVEFVRRNLGSPANVTSHQVHAPEIELTSPTTARGVWALEDVVRLAPAVHLRGYGHYHETYRKVGGQWRIATSQLTRLRMDVFNGLFSVYISPRVQRTLTTAIRRFMR